MRRNDDRVSTVFTLQLHSLLGAVLLANQFTGTAIGHTLLLSQGDVVIDENSASINLEVSAEDFLHWYGLPSDLGGRISAQALRRVAERHALALHQILTLRDAAGERLPSDEVHVQLDVPDESVPISDLRNFCAIYITKFSYPSAPRYLTFQLFMDGDFPSVYWQVVLSVDGHGKDRGRLIRLTSRGNAETVEIAWKDRRANVVSGEFPPAFSPSCASDGATGSSAPCADIEFGTKSIEVRITMPLVLLQTWLALSTGDDELLEPDQQESARETIKRFLVPVLSVESEGRRYVAEVTSVAFLSIDEKEMDPHAEGKAYSLLTGRLVARLHFETSNALQRADLHWNLFNNAVLSATAVISGNGPAVLHEFSTYQPNYHWQRVR